MIGAGRPLVPEILDQNDRVGAKSPIFDLFARSKAVTLSEKTSINTNSKSTTRFPVSPIAYTSYVVPKPPPPKGG